MLRIGCVKYLNAQPLIHGWEGKVDFDHPSALCNKLAAGKLDVALVSSFEFLRNPIYRIVDDVSISSDGPVYSVVVAHNGEIAEIEEIELDPASETSANLLRCTLAELGLNPRLGSRGRQSATGRLRRGEPVAVGDPPEGGLAVANLPTTYNARLLIGDQAIRFRQEYANELSFWDLGEQWQKLIGLPFVYALWLIRPEVTDRKPIANRLRNLRDRNLANLDDLIADSVVGVSLSLGSSKAEADGPIQWKGADHEFLSRYYREHLRFSCGEEEKEGLRIFAHLCAKHGLLPKRDLAFPVV
jgi:predicted solute-binding protein